MTLIEAACAAHREAGVHARPKRRQGITGQTIDMETLK